MCAALATVLLAPERGRAVGAAGRQRAQDVFSPERTIDTVERVYRSLA